VITDSTDQPSGIRRGEELPIAPLGVYLQTSLPEFSGALSVQQFPSGHSNLTFLVRVGEQEMVLRRPPFGANIKSAHDMGREYKILSHVHPVYSLVPRPLLYCDDASVIGAPFYLMERVKGIVLRDKAPQGLALAPEMMRDLSNAFVDNLVAIHAVDYRAAGLGELGKPIGYVARQVRGWTERYVNAKTDEIPEMERVAAWLAEHLPLESGVVLIHNDYKYDNLVLEPQDLTRLKAVLDWEMATIGDPLMDLGTTLGYWVEQGDPEERRIVAPCLTMLPGNLTREQIVQRYAQVSGRDVSSIRFYYVFGLFKIAVIIQQIYNRWKQGFSQDPRFAEMIDSVRAFSKEAAREIEKVSMQGGL
jgi:aminoglycoside phosphotransferase (APT) family kinase protein